MSLFKETSASMHASGVDIDIIDLCYSVNVNKKDKMLLRNVSFSIQAGEMVALMGPSGAGKSTLLDLIADRKLDGSWSGMMYFDKKRRSPHFSRDSAYVLQDDIHIPTLTVQETIYYSAWTRLPEGTSKEDIWKRVNQLLNITGLKHVKDMIVGSGMQRGISGGQLKRLSIAVEIVALPNLIFLDEPTSGLDSTIALEVMSAVRGLANQHRTCVSTIHQPSPEVFALFDKVVLLSEGRLIYFGDAKSAVNCFTNPVMQRSSVPLPSHLKHIASSTTKELCNTYYVQDEYKNAADLIIEVSGGQLKPKGRNASLSAEQLERRFIESEYFVENRISTDEQRRIDQTRTEADEPIPLLWKLLSNDRKYHYHATTKVTQFRMLMDRTWNSLMRDVEDLRAQVIKNVVVGLLCGTVFYQQAVNPEPLYSYGLLNSSVINVTSILFFGMMYTLVSNMQSIPYLCSRNKLYRRELASFTYSAAPFWLSQSIAIMPILLVNQLIYGTLCFYMCGFKNTLEFFFYFLANLFLCNLASFYFAMYLAAVLNNEQLSFSIFPLFFTFLLTFAGYSISVDDVPPFWTWAPWVSYARWGFEGLVTNQWEDFPTDDSPYAVNGNGNVLAYYSFEGFNKWDSLWILSLYVMLTMLVTYFALRPLKSSLKYVPEGLVEAVDALDAADASNPLHSSSTASSLNAPLLANNETAVAVSESDVDDWFVEETDASMRSKGYHVVFRDVCYTVNNNALLNETLPARAMRLFKSFGSDSTALTEPALTTTEKENSQNSYGASEIQNVITNNSSSNSSATGTGTGTHTVQLLHSVFGEAKPGEMVALMGSSGAGKSTLLDVLSDRKTTGTITGKICFNGEERNEAIAKASAYVMQDNVHIGMLTVRETLYYAAQLRLDEKWDEDTKRQRVDKVMSMLGLAHVQHTIVGTDTQRGISGGQLKRLSIGVEIINLPGVLFLDEPTTGLDAALAFEVMASIKRLANQNRTIICTIHQPSPQTFELFNTLLLLSAGKVVYFGQTKDAVAYFSSDPLNFDYQRGQNPADYVVNVASISSSSSTKTSNFSPLFSINDEEANPKTSTTNAAIAAQPKREIDLAAHFQSTEQYQAIARVLATIDENALANNSLSRNTSTTSKQIVLSHYTSVRNQVQVLCSRALLMNKKSKKLLFITFLRHIVVAIFYGTIYFHLPTGTSQNAYSNRLCLFFFSSVFLLVGHQSTIPNIHQLRLVFYRERGSRAYGSFAYWLSNWIFEIPTIAINVLAFGCILHSLSGLRNTSDSYGLFLLVLFVNSFIGLFVCQFVAAIASSTQAAVSIYPVFLFFSVAFAGFIVYLPDFPFWLGDWAPYLSFMRYCIEGLAVNEFKGNDDLPYSEQFLDSLGYNTMSARECLGYQTLFILLFGVMVLLAIEFVSFEVR